MLRRLILFALFVAIGLIIYSAIKRKKPRELNLDGLKIAEKLPLFQEAVTLCRQIEQLYEELPEMTDAFSESLTAQFDQELPECMWAVARLAQGYESLMTTKRAVRGAEVNQMVTQKQAEIESQVTKITENLRDIYGELLSFAMPSEEESELGDSAVQKTQSLLDELRMSVKAEREISESVRKNQDLMRGLE